MSTQSSINQPGQPRVGMLATIRNRRALVTSVEPFDSKTEGRLHLVRLEYTDADGIPEDAVVWEREFGPTLLEPNALPQVAAEAPMPARDFDALLRAVRWTALSPFLPTGDDDTGPTRAIASPFFGAVQMDDFQMVPLTVALRMPRISLLLADDVGLGKTVEIGFVLTELLLRRRIRRVLILCGASLRHQWREEMKSKFSLTFDVVDRASTHALQKRLGLDANPWRTYPRVISSYHYLRQPDVLEQFRAACRQPEGTAQLPWDLLIVDESHNLMPSNFGEDSDLAKMLRHISPWFEHKIFATATPHNGHTRCFSGLLEQLDPARFTQTAEFTEAARREVGRVVVRRLKREINELDQREGRQPRFAERFIAPVPLYFGAEERELSAAFQRFRSEVKRLIAASPRGEQMAGNFAVEVLNKRLLSCPHTFGDSWYRFKEGMAEDEAVEASEVHAARRAAEEDVDDDREAEGRARHAARTTGAWLRPLAGHLATHIADVDYALERLGLEPPDGGPMPYPVADERWERLVTLVRQRMRDGNAWKADERLIVFTEYKTTLDYLERRLKELFGMGGAIRVLYGGMPDADREAIKRAFNDPDDPLRVLVATDAASEGQNLQETARFLFHYEIPWNPSRLEQRNGRLDRHGQARDVTVFHFTSDDDADLKFLSHVVGKVNSIREDLGSMTEVFDAAFQQRFLDLQDADSVIGGLDAAVERHRGRAAVPRGDFVETGREEAQALRRLAGEIDLTPETLKDTLEIALGLGGAGLPRFEGPDSRGRLKLRQPLPPRWERLVDDSLRLEGPSGQRGPIPAVVFDPGRFVEVRNGRPVFRTPKDTALLHLGHPLFHHALALFARSRFPGGSEAAPSRWTVRYGAVPEGADALLLLSVEELAVNELREPFHHWVRTVRLPVAGGRLGPPLPHVPAGQDAPSDRPVDEQAVRWAQDVWEEVARDVKGVLAGMSKELTAAVERGLRETGKAVLEEEKERFRQRIREVEKAMRETSLQSLEKERDKLLAELRQGALFPDYVRKKEEELQNLEDELRRRRHHFQELLDYLKGEQTRTTEHLLPKRHHLRGQVQAFPVAVEVRLPEVTR